MDILLLICSFLEDVDLFTLMSVSSAFYHIARQLQHHTVRVDMDLLWQTEARLDILSSGHLLAAVRVLEITFKNTPEGEVGADKILARLVDMLPGMTGLRDLHWHMASPSASQRLLPQQWQVPSPIPRSILDRIPSRTRLYTSIYVKDEPHDRARAFLAQLIDNKNLHSLSIHIGFSHDPECGATMVILKRVLLSCPHLVRIPCLFVTPPPYHSGPYFGEVYCGLGLSGGEKPPALEEMGIGEYPWGSESTELTRSRRDPWSIGYPEKGNETEYWAETFDWSRLRKINNIPGGLIRDLAPKLTALKEINFDASIFYRDKVMLLEQIPTTLESLSFPSWQIIGNRHSAIIRHGDTLRKLVIHWSEPTRLEAPMADSDLVILSKGLPHLEELAFDLSRDDTKNDWLYETLDIVADFPRLRNLQLYLALPDPRALRAPHVTVSTIRQLLTYLRNRNRNIQRLELSSFSIEDPSMRFPNHAWGIQNSIRLICEVSFHGVDAADGLLRVTSPDFSPEMNLELSRLEREPQKRREPVAGNAKELMLDVAIHGPLIPDSWRLPGDQSQRQRRSVMKRLVSRARSWI